MERRGLEARQGGRQRGGGFGEERKKEINKGEGNRQKERE